MVFLSRLREEARKVNCEVDQIPLHGAGLISFLLDASDIDPLPPHYSCPVCGRIEPVPNGKDGYDLTSKTCCGVPMVQSGHAIPFAPFLAQFKREPVPLRFRLPDACYSDVFTYREDVWDTLLLASGPGQRCGVGLADRLAGRTRRGAFVREGMDTETVRILRELGVQEHWITQMGRTCYLPPKADVIQTPLDELKCVWWEQRAMGGRNHPITIQGAVA